MQTAPTSYLRQALPDGVQFVLPQRQLGAVRWAGLAILAFGLFFSGSAVVWIIHAVQGTMARGFSGFGLVLAAFGLPFVIAGLAAAFIGLAILIGHSEIRLRQGEVRVVERAGPFFWSRKRPLSRLRRLEIMQDSVKVDDRPVTSGPLANLSALSGHFEGAKPLYLAIGYPKAMIAALADELAMEVKRLGSTIESPGHLAVAPVVEIVHTSPEDEPDTVPPQPEGSAVVLERRADGLTLTVPALGYLKGSSGLGCFGIAWNGFMCVFTGGMVWAMVNGQAGSLKDRGSALFAVGFLGLFWAVGIGLVLAALNMGRRRGVIDVVGHPGHTLLVTRQSLFRLRQETFSRDDIAAVCCGPSGIEVNDKPVPQLQIHPVQGKKLGLFTGRKEPELRWMAALLREALRVPTKRSSVA